MAPVSFFSCLPSWKGLNPALSSTTSFTHANSPRGWTRIKFKKKKKIHSVEQGFPVQNYRFNAQRTCFSSVHMRKFSDVKYKYLKLSQITCIPLSESHVVGSAPSTADLNKIKILSGFVGSLSWMHINREALLELKTWHSSSEHYKPVTLRLSCLHNVFSWHTDCFIFIVLKINLYYQ